MRKIFMATLFALPFSFAHAQAASPLRRIKGADIRALLSGKEFTDEVHWVERYRANGTIEGASMGRRFEKRWAVRSDTMCLSDARSETCYEIWRSGEKMEMRRPGGDDFPRAGTIRKQGK